jgi:chromate reductase
MFTISPATAVAFRETTTDHRLPNTVGVLLGSFRAGSFTRSVAEYAALQLPEGWVAEFPELDKLPLFNQGLDDSGFTPGEWTTFRSQVVAFDAILMVTPEHNRSFPAVLKNALDIASRPAGQSVWSGKPAAVISVSPSRIGGAIGNQHIRQPLAFLNIRVMTAPELYVSDVADLLDANGELTDESTQNRIKKFIEAFTEWVSR